MLVTVIHAVEITRKTEINLLYEPKKASGTPLLDSQFISDLEDPMSPTTAYDDDQWW